MTWDEIFNVYQNAALANRNAEANEHLEVARKRVSQNSEEDWAWLETALGDSTKKWFVAWLFRWQPIPRRLFGAMVQASIANVDASSIRRLIEPCVATFGRESVAIELERLQKAGMVSTERIDQFRYWLDRSVDFSRATKPSDRIA